MNYSSTARRTRRPSRTGNNRYHTNRKRKTSGHGQYIDPSRFIKAAQPAEADEYQPINNFADFPLNEKLQHVIKKRGFVSPSQIQDQSILPALQGKDIVGIANTGTGKTAAFLLPLLQKLLTDRKQKALIIAPTRELAIQIQNEAQLFAQGTGLVDVLLIGGAPMHKQTRNLQRRPDIVIGTPGRIQDHVNRKTLRLNVFHTLVLDEVDRMLDMGFLKDIQSILTQIHSDKQSLFFSATLDEKIHSLIRTFTKDPVTIMARTSETSDNVEQTVTKYVEKTDKIEKLHEVLLAEGTEKTLIFCETKHGSDRLSKELNGRGFKTDAIHGNKSQGQRQRALAKFKQSDIDILVATDVAARGLDISDVSHVINYDVPHTWEDYTHRIGRTGRGGKTGTSVTFVGQSS